MYTVNGTYFKKDEILQICKIGLHVFYFYWFLAICINCVPLILMLKHYRVSNYLGQYKSHVIAVKA